MSGIYIEKRHEALKMVCIGLSACMSEISACMLERERERDRDRQTDRQTDGGRGG